MKKATALVLAVICLFSLVGCGEKHPTGFDGNKLYINVGITTLVYERYAPGTGSLTEKKVLDNFSTVTEIEGIDWNVYSVEEYPDLSYVVVISGTNSSWTYRRLDI